MNINIASQNQGIIAWTGAAARPIDLRNHVNFAFTFNVTADIGADTKFQFESAPPSDADPCVPGAWTPVKEVLTCSAPWGSVASDNAEVVIPNGTKKGAICTGALPCKPDAFIRVAPTAGETGDVVIIAVLGGPK
jgi:hypothetical protein